MNTWIFVWFFMAAISTLAVVVVGIAFVRHSMSVGRTAKRFQREVGPLTEQIQTLSAQAGERAARIQAEGVKGDRPKPER